LELRVLDPRRDDDELGVLRLVVPDGAEDLGSHPDRRAPPGLDHLVLELELELSGDHEVDLLLLGMAVPVGTPAPPVRRHPPGGTLAARVLRPPPVGQRHLLALQAAGEHSHLAGVVAEDVVDLLQPRHRVAGHISLLSGVGRVVGTSIGDLSVGMRKRLTLAACILGSTIVFVDSSVVNVALPAMQRDLGGGLALQQWAVDAYLLTLGSLILVGGSLGDLFGQRRVFVIGVVAFAITSVLCAVAWNEGSLIAARAAQGVAGALLTPASLATISVLFEGEERGAAIGTWTAWTGIAFLIGPLVGAWPGSAVSWRG